MNLRPPFVALSAAILFAACSTDLVAPAKTVTAPSFSVSTDASDGSYLVLMRGNGVASDFATRVIALGGSVTYANSNAGFALVRGLTASAAAQIGTLSGVADIQADQSFTLDQPLATAEADVTAAFDPSINSQANPTTALRYSWQWNMRLIGANDAWAAGKLGSPGVTVAILDTGIDYDAPDLTGLVDLSRSTSFVASDNVITTNFFPTRNQVSDYNGHGTNVATQVSSKAFALAGVTSRTTLIGVKVLSRTGSGSSGGVLAGILWAADNGADVANMSLGGGFAKAGNGQFNALLNRVFNYAKQRGMLIVVSAGNDARDLQHEGNFFTTYCDALHVLCVSSVGPRLANSDPNEPAYYTNYGRSVVDVAAPGGNADAFNNFTLSAWPWGADIASWVWSYCSKTRIAGLTSAGVPILTACAAGNRLSGFIGTSQASPHAAGLAALLVAEYGHGKPQAIKRYIQKSAIDIDPLFGRGRISVTNALGL